MRRRLRALGVTTLLTLVAADVAVHLFVVRTHWRPLPPFGALTNEQQAIWLVHAQAEVAGREAPRGLGAFDPVLGWTLRPSAISDDGRTHTNARGWRGTREYGDVSPPGVLRVVCCGDSFTFCDEVADEEAWPHLLEERLAGKAEVPNLGVGGYGTDQALMRLGHEYPRAPVDAVLIGLLLENIGRNVNRYRPRWYPRADSPVAKPRFIEGDKTLELVPIPYEREGDLLAAVASGRVLVDLREHEHWRSDHLPPGLAWSGFARLWAGHVFYAERELPRLWSDVEGEPFRVTTRILRAFASFAQAPEGNQARAVVVLVFPTHDDLERFRGDGKRYWQPLLDYLAKERIPVIDLTDALAKAEDDAAPDAPSLWSGSHLSGAGNAIVARQVHGWIDLHL